jgi:hypothetical protein
MSFFAVKFVLRTCAMPRTVCNASLTLRTNILFMPTLNEVRSFYLSIIYEPVGVSIG